MIEIKNTKVYGLEESIMRSGYPHSCGEPGGLDYIFSSNSERVRAKKLAQVPQGSGHDCFLKGIVVNFDLKYSLYFTKQLQRYHFIDFISSQSTMHSILSMDISQSCNKYVHYDIIKMIENFVELYKKEEDQEKKYEYFMQIVSNLPCGFEYWAAMTTNYLQLKSIYNQRKNHKLQEDWGYFCEWITGLPMFNRMVLGVEEQC